jgi:hypothetical protein
MGRSADDQSLTELVTQAGYGKGDDTFYGAAIGRRLARFWTHFVVDLEAGVGYRAGATDGGEGWAALYFRFDGFPWARTLYTAFGVSTGVSWVSRLPPPERVSEQQSQWLHYFSPELAFALPDYRAHELVLRYHHRSGAFGAIAGVWDGSNVVSLGYRRRF